MSDNARWVRPLGTARREGWDVVVDPADDWQHTGLLVTSLAEGESRDVAAGEWEHVVVPLSGSVLAVPSRITPTFASTVWSCPALATGALLHSP